MPAPAMAVARRRRAGPPRPAPPVSTTRIARSSSATGCSISDRTEVRCKTVDPRFRDRIVERGAVPDPRTPQAYTEFIRVEIEKWKEVAQAANVKLD